MNRKEEKFLPFSLSHKKLKLAAKKHFKKEKKRNKLTGERND